MFWNVPEMSNQSVNGLPQVIHKLGHSSSQAHYEHMLDVLERPWNVKSVNGLSQVIHELGHSSC